MKVETELRDEDVFRQGASAPGLRDAVFKVATRASDHLITAYSMFSRLRTGQDAGHDFEHDGEEGHVYAEEQPQKLSQREEVAKAFPVLSGPYISTKLWLERLEKADFDVFRSELRQREWKLPWRAWWVNRKGYF